MSFDKPTRNKLAAMVGDCRRLLTEDIRDQLQAVYGLQPDGTALPIERLGHLDDAGGEVARELREWQEHVASTEIGTESEKKKSAFDRVALETAFTVLNRLAALRMCEERGHVIECVRRGMESDGFVLYERLSGGVFGTRGETYRIFLEHMFDELAVDLGVLFDRRAPQSLVFPRERCLEQVLSLLNSHELTHLWKEDETIGWIYQYFNSKEEREAMRAASAAPRNSRELAVRNQFFTPRYVVEFLVDNTLGRIWYEMRKGDTALKDACLYLVRRPTEIFLKENEQAPASPNGEENLSQEQLLERPVYVAHRPKKDPRDLKILDPACGSGHFLLYAFDLLETVYEEAWADQRPVKSEVTRKTLREEYADLDSLKRALPELILRHNLHGIDIDLRACQIAALALWLRAQRGYQRLRLKQAERPKITKSNIVCAEPMPGERQLLDQFVADLQPKVLGQLVQVVFEKMKLAGEAGSLLKIEEEIVGAVADAKKKWLAGLKPEQTFLFGDLRPQQTELSLDFSGITDETFWGKAEERIYAELQTYAERAENGCGYQRRLFADDAARGFAFVDLCRGRYDVALMNPPFGDCSMPSKGYLEETYGDTKGDVYKAFVECFQSRLLPAGCLGIISSRTGFFLGQSEDWRTRIVLRLFRPLLLADLGGGVLDAMVEVAAYVLRNLSETEAYELTLSLVPVLRTVALDRQGRFSIPKWQVARGDLKRHQAAAELAQLESAGFIQRCPGDIARYTTAGRELPSSPPRCSFQPIVCIRALADLDKGTALAEAARNVRDPRMFVCDPLAFKKVPGTPFAYWIGTRIRNVFGTLPTAESDERRIALGLSTKNDVRFVRLWWEVVPAEIARDRKWANYANGGSFSPFYYSYRAVVLAENDCSELRAYLIAKFPYLDGNTGWILHDENDYRSPTIAWPLRTHAFSPALLPANFFFSARTYAAVVPREQLPHYLGLFASKIVDFLLKVSLGRAGYPEFVTGVVRSLPVPLGVEEQEGVAARALQAWAVKRNLDAVEPTSLAFVLPSLLSVSGDAIDERVAAWQAHVRTSIENLAIIQSEIDNLILRLYGLHDDDHAAMSYTPSGAETCAASNGAGEDDADTTNDRTAVDQLTADLLDHAAGCAFGRWDIRFATGQKKKPDLPDPFTPLPSCSSGMLQNQQGLPLTQPDVHRLQAAGQWDYPLEIPWDGILVDDPDHADDITRRVREVLTVIWKDRAEAIEQDVCEILQVKDLHEYFRKPSLFFAHHLKRYSKSRRQAPIYWQLSTASGSYTLWIYYHRLSDDLLYTALNKYVKPKIDTTEKELRRIESELPNATGREASALRTSFERTTSLLDELREFRDELARVAELPYKPNLNDGVLITASPLWKLFRLPKWRKDLQDCWNKLAAGEYDWAHLAYSIWPDRVREVCRHDRSIAIAHGLEELCEVAPKPATKKRSKKAEIEETVLGGEE